MANLSHCYRRIKVEQVLLVIRGFAVHSGDYKDRVTLVIIVMFIVLCLFKCFVLCNV